MAYWQKRWCFRNSTEYDFCFIGKYGAAGEKREPRKKATSEQVQKQNQWNRETKIRRLIKANFLPEDLWCALKYPAGTAKRIEEVMDDLKRFLEKGRYHYKKRCQPLKFIYRIEIGKRGGIHIHILLNRLQGEIDTDVLIQNLWEPGRVNFQNIYEAGGYKELAAYIVKKPTKEIEGQINMFGEEERKYMLKYSTSRNLVRPVPEKKRYFRRTLRRLIEEGPKPTQGYYIDEESVYGGVNPVTGMSYLHYTETRIRPEGRRDRKRERKADDG